MSTPTVRFGTLLLACASLLATGPSGAQDRASAPALAPPSFVAQWGGFTRPEGLEVDSRGHVWVADTGGNRILEFDNNGGKIQSFGGGGGGDGQLNAPTDVVAAGGFVYVVDAHNNRIQKLTPSGAFVTVWGGLGSSQGLFDHPSGIGFAGNAIFVSDTFNDRVQRFDADGVFLSEWGNAGTGNGQFTTPFGLDVNGSVFVADMDNARIQVFDLSGNHVRSFGSLGSGNGQFRNPRDVAFDPSTGRIYVADTANHRIQAFDASGNYLFQWGTRGSIDGRFKGPFGIDIDDSGSVFVLEVGNERVQKFSYCSFALDANGATFDSAGGTGAVGVDVTGECGWEAESRASWITVSSGQTGTGDGTVNFSVDAHNRSQSRTGTIEIAGQEFTVTQTGIACAGATVSPSSSTYDDRGGEGGLTVTAPAGCSWMATSSAGWVAIDGSGSGSGNGAVEYRVDRNTGAASRSASLNVAGASHTVIQSAQTACSYRVAPRRRGMPAIGGTSTLRIRTEAGCSWAAGSDEDWISIADGAGAGPATVSFSIVATRKKRPRKGFIRVMNRRLKVRQKGGTLGEAPDRPRRLRLRLRGDDRIRIKWKDRSDNEDGFLITRRSLGDEDEIIVLPPDTKRYDDEELLPEVEYCYTIQAVNLGGRSESLKACARTSGARAPADLRADTSGPGEVVLSWDGPRNRIERYLVQRRRADRPRWSTLGEVSPRSGTYSDGTAPSGQLLEYRVIGCTPECTLESNTAEALPLPASPGVAPDGYVSLEPDYVRTPLAAWLTHWTGSGVDRPVVRIYKDHDPWWGEAAVETGLESLGYPIGDATFIHSLDELPAGVPDGTSIVILPSASDPGAAPREIAMIGKRRSWLALDVFVRDGGVLLAHLGDPLERAGYEIPGATGFPSAIASDTCDLSDPTCRVAMGNLETGFALPSDATALAHAPFGGQDRVVTARYAHGDGTVIVTTRAVEWLRRGVRGHDVSAPLEELLRLALEIVRQEPSEP